MARRSKGSRPRGRRGDGARRAWAHALTRRRANAAHASAPLRPRGFHVVLYHHLTDRPTDLVDRLGVSTPPALFEAHLVRLMRDYEIVDLDSVLSGRLPKRALLVTFDDGYRSILDVAAPLLKRFGIPSVFFVSGAFVRPGSLPLDNLLCWLSHRVPLHELETVITRRRATSGSFLELMPKIASLPYERRGELRQELAERFGVDLAELRREGGLFLGHLELERLSHFGIEVGNHTDSHLHCRSLVDENAAYTELVGHKLELEKWAGARVRSFSYPYGNRRDATPFVERVLAGSGHEAFFLVESRPNTLRHRGPTWQRVSLRDKPVSRLYLELELLPRLRALRDRLRVPTPVKQKP